MTWAGVRDRLADLSAAGPDFSRVGAGKHRYRLSAPECPDEDDWRPGFLSTPFPFTEAWNRAEHHPIDNEIPDDLYFDQRWITGSPKVAHFGCGAYFRLVVTGPEPRASGSGT